MQINDYIEARLRDNPNEVRQGTYIRDNVDGTIEVEGALDTYTCLRDGVEVITDVWNRRRDDSRESLHSKGRKRDVQTQAPG